LNERWRKIVYALGKILLLRSGRSQRAASVETRRMATPVFRLKKGNVSVTVTMPLWLQNLKALGHSQGYLTCAQVNESLALAIVEHSGIHGAPA
jgi:hypothetical protein